MEEEEVEEEEEEGVEEEEEVEKEVIKGIIRLTGEVITPEKRTHMETVEGKI